MQIVGILLGLVYCFFGLQSAFTISSRDPWSIWIILLLGPFLTLPASLVSYLYAKPSMIVLAIGSCVSAVLALVTYPMSDALFLVCGICVPNIIIAGLVLWRKGLTSRKADETVVS